MTRNDSPRFSPTLVALGVALALAGCQKQDAKAPQALAQAPAATTSTTEVAPPEGKTVVVPPGATVTITPAPEAAGAPAPAPAPAAKAPARERQRAARPAATGSAASGTTEMPPTAAGCPNCGTIESVRQVEQQGKGTGLGVIGGAVVGGLLGHQVGGGRGQDLATIAGAVGGGYAGHKIEEKARSTSSWEVAVRFDDGTRRVFKQSTQPSWREGDPVKVIDGRIVAR